jgi:hypothetical protein
MPIVFHRFPAAGSYRIGLKVTDATGRSAVTSTTLVVPPGRPGTGGTGRRASAAALADSYACAQGATAGHTGPCVKSIELPYVDAETDGCFTEFQRSLGEQAANTNGRKTTLYNPVSTKVSGSMWQSAGTVRLNGLELTPGAGSVIIVDEVHRFVASSGDVRVRVLGSDIVLQRSGTLLKYLPSSGQSVNLGTFGGIAGASVAELAIGGSASVSLTPDLTTVVHGQLVLPPPFTFLTDDPTDQGGVSGDITLVADNHRGLHLDGIHVHVDDAPIGPIELKDLDFAYSGSGSAWSGAATLSIPTVLPFEVSASIAIDHGALTEVTAGLGSDTGGVIIAPFVYLQKAQLHLGFDPLAIGGTVEIGAGEIRGFAPLRIDGGATLTLTWPLVFRVDGSLSVFETQLANAYALVSSAGYVHVHGHLDADLLNLGILTARADVDGRMLGTQFDIEGDARVCLNAFGLSGCAGGDVLLSNIGVEACAELLGVHVGARFTWDLSDVEVMGSSCGTGKYRVVIPDQTDDRKLAANAPLTIDLRAGRTYETLAVQGSGAPPTVTLRGPDGTTLTAGPGSAAKTDRIAGFSAARTNTTYFLVRNPAGGRWTIAAQPGSAPLRQVLAADPLPAPQVTASITGDGATRVLRYRVQHLAGQRVAFFQEGAQLERRLGTTSGGRGAIRFVTAGTSGPQTVVAVVSQDGWERTRLVVARYRATGAPLAAPRVQVRRAGSTLRATWTPVAGAVRYRVAVALADGRRLRLDSKRRTVAVGGVGDADRARVWIAAVGRDGHAGHVAVVTVRRR